MRSFEANPDGVIRQAGLDPRLLDDENNIIPYATFVHHMQGMAEEARIRLEGGSDDPWATFRDFLLECAGRHERERLLSQVLATQPSSWFRHAAVVETELAERAAELMRRAQAAGAVRPDARGDDIPVIMCGLSAVLEADWGPSAWRRYMQLMLDGLRAPGSARLP